MDASKSEPSDPRRPDGVMTVHMVHGRIRVYGDEDGVGQVGEDDGELSRRLVLRTRVNDSKASRLGGRSDM